MGKFLGLGGKDWATIGSGPIGWGARGLWEGGKAVLGNDKLGQLAYNIPIVGPLFGNPHKRKIEDALGDVSDRYASREASVAARGENQAAFADNYFDPADRLINPDNDPRLNPSMAQGFARGPAAQYSTGVGDSARFGREMSEPNALASNMGRFDMFSRGQSGAEQYWNGMQGSFQDPTASAQHLNNMRMSLDPNLDAAYDRAYETGSRRIGDTAAATGLFNSGRNQRNLETFAADLGARQAQEEAQYGLQVNQARQQAAQQADAANMARFGAGAGFALGMDQNAAQRMDLYRQALSGADATSLGANSIRQNAFAAGDADAARRMQLGLNANIAGDRMEMDRFGAAFDDRLRLGAARAANYGQFTNPANAASDDMFNRAQDAYLSAQGFDFKDAEKSRQQFYDDYAFVDNQAQKHFDNLLSGMSAFGGGGFGG